MNKTQTDQLLKIWSKAHWLRNCDRTFATKPQREEWDKLERVSALEQFMTALETKQGTKTSLLNSFGSALETVQPVITSRAKLTSEVNANVLRWLKDSQLVGLGFETPRKLDSAVLVLPTEIWHGHIDWAGSSIKFQSLRFVDIRVTHAKRLEEHNNHTLTHTKPRGRPTIAHDLQDRFEQLNLAGEIDTSRSMVSHFPKIRAWLNENRTESGQSEFEVSNEAIRSKFSHFFKVLKAKYNVKSQETKKQ